VIGSDILLEIVWKILYQAIEINIPLQQELLASIDTLSQPEYSSRALPVTSC
jgi:hypothetical protein